jgi:hypothetical protein
MNSALEKRVVELPAWFDERYNNTNSLRTSVRELVAALRFRAIIMKMRCFAGYFGPCSRIARIGHRKFYGNRRGNWTND